MPRNSATAEVIDKILLVGLGAGTLAGSLLLPGAIIALGPIFEGYNKGYDRRQKEREYRKLIAYMKRQQLLRLEPKRGNGLVLTKKGLQRAQRAMTKYLLIDTTGPWDKKWRMVMFDIPEPYKPKRDLLSSSLKRLGFYQLQKSVWLHPYPCREEVTQLAMEYDLGKYITFIEVAQIDRQKDLKRIFTHIIK